MKVRYEPKNHSLVTDDVEMREVAVFNDSITQTEAEGLFAPEVDWKTGELEYPAFIEDDILARNFGIK